MTRSDRMGATGPEALGREGLAAVFLEILGRRLSQPAQAWIDGARPGRAVSAVIFADTFAAAARRLGSARLTLDAPERACLQAAGVDWPLSAWTVDELGRISLLLSVAGSPADTELPSIVEDCYEHGDNRERQAVLRALPLLPRGERFLPVALEACRTHVQPIFEAIACENPYPAAHFPEASFNHLVLKALFTGVALGRIWGLDNRVTPELMRMADDYASERRAAGRSVPPDIWRVTTRERSER